MDGRDVATRVSDLPQAALVDSSAHALEHIQERRDPGAATPVGGPTTSSRAAAPIVGGLCHHQRVGPNTIHDPSPTPVRHPRYAAALARPSRQATVDVQAT